MMNVLIQGKIAQTLFISAAGAAALFASVPASAHHAFAMFDNDRIVALNGTVKDFQWTNPHTFIQIVVMDPKTRKITEWSVEGQSPRNMISSGGWKPRSLKPGDKAIVYVHPVRDGSPRGSLVNASINGKLIGSAKVTQG